MDGRTAFLIRRSTKYSWSCGGVRRWHDAKGLIRACGISRVETIILVLPFLTQIIIASQITSYLSWHSLRLPILWGNLWAAREKTQHRRLCSILLKEMGTLLIICACVCVVLYIRTESKSSTLISLILAQRTHENRPWQAMYKIATGTRKCVVYVNTAKAYNGQPLLLYIKQPCFDIFHQWALIKSQLRPRSHFSHFWIKNVWMFFSVLRRLKVTSKLTTFRSVISLSTLCIP